MATSRKIALVTGASSGIGRAAVRVRIVEGEWFDAFSDEQRSSFDLIITNPPYVSIDDELPHKQFMPVVRQAGQC